MGIFLYIVILKMSLILEFLCRSCNVYDFLIINVSFEYRNGILKELNVKGIQNDIYLVVEDLVNNIMDLYDMMICLFEGVCMLIMLVFIIWCMFIRNIIES